MKKEVKITSPAVKQLEKLEEYYISLGYVNRVEKLREEIVNQSQLLSKNPKMGQIETHLEHLHQEHRYLLVNPHYKIIYIEKVECIYIVDIFDARQNPEKIKRSNKG